MIDWLIDIFINSFGKIQDVNGLLSQLLYVVLTFSTHATAAKYHASDIYTLNRPGICTLNPESGRAETTRDDFNRLHFFSIYIITWKLIYLRKNLGWKNELSSHIAVFVTLYFSSWLVPRHFMWFSDDLRKPIIYPEWLFWIIIRNFK